MRCGWAVCAAVVLAGSGAAIRAQRAGNAPSLTGTWVLDRASSQVPRDIGFNLVTILPDAGAAAGGERPQAPSTMLRESEADAKRREQLVDEVRNPAPRLAVADSDTMVMITGPRGPARTFHPTSGRDESVVLPDQTPVPVASRWTPEGLEIRYLLEGRREVRYVLARDPTAPRLSVQVQFVERGKGGDTVRLVYRAGTDKDAEAAAAPAPSPAPQAPAPPAGMPGKFGASDIGRPAGEAPQLSVAPAAPVARGPDAALKGLKKLGLVIEDFGQQETACGLKQATVQATLAKILSDAGLQIVRNSDEDTYLYAHVMAATASNGLCVSRYDVALYSYTMATLSYQSAPVLTQVELFHKGGLAGGAPAAHAESVMRGLKQYTEEIAGRIRDINR